MEIIKKKLSTYKNAQDQVRNVPNDLLLEVLTAWETWMGSKKDFYRTIGIGYKGMASMLGKAKRLRREGKAPVTEFKELTDAILGEQTSVFTGSVSQGIELTWDQGKVIRFPQVEVLIDFLKKVA